MRVFVNACSAGQTSGAGEDETRATSRISQSPLSALARSKNHQKRYFAGADLVVESGNQAPCMGAVGVVFIAKLRTQQVLLCINAGNERDRLRSEKQTPSQSIAERIWARLA